MTPTGQFDATNDGLRDLADADPFVRCLLKYREAENLLGSFVGKSTKGVLHPSFDPLVRSGRTSSSGDINAQNLPRNNAVRSCFIPSHGHEFIDSDYAAIEMATLAQACFTQFGLDSAMAKSINAGGDLHTLVAAKMLGKPADDVTPDERRKAKPINFGKPGGMGPEALVAYAKTAYGVALSPEEVDAWSNAWSDLFPEMAEFLAAGRDTAAELAELLDLALASHHELTGDARFLKYATTAGLEDRPSAILGGMLLKVAKVEHPSTRNGMPYSVGDRDYFWTKLAQCSDRLPQAQRESVPARRPSATLWRAVCDLVGLAPVYTFTGRIRAGANYCARHNTVFQGLAADGAKLALWRLWRAGFRIVNFIHDQVLIEIPKSTPRERMAYARRIRDHMIEGMREVVPDIRIDVRFAASDRWYTDAEAVETADGEELQLWSPPSP